MLRRPLTSPLGLARSIHLISCGVWAQPLALTPHVLDLLWECLGFSHPFKGLGDSCSQLPFCDSTLLDSPLG